MRRFAKKHVMVTLGVAGASLLAGVGIAGAASSTKPEYQATYQMYADVSAKGALLAGHDVTNVLTEPEDGPTYDVIFKHPVTHCAAVVQPGQTSGTLTSIYPGAYADVVSTASSPNDVVVYFSLVNDELTKPDPFMLVVTCNS
jgi:hypothetical protein